MKIILASASARRQELLKRITEEFTITVSDFDEDSVTFDGNLESYVQDIAFGKAEKVASKLKDGIVIGCDTIVTFEGRILGKPKDEEEAEKMLKDLSGKVHKVYSGLAIINIGTDEIIKDFEMTEVEFDDLEDDLIKKYVKSGDPMDKAGAYGIQGFAGIFVKKINGDYYSVVGLPLNKLYKLLNKYDL